MNPLLSFIQAAFAIVQYWRIIQDNREAPAQKIYIHFSAVLYVFGVVLHLALFKSRKSLPRFVRRYIHFFADIRGLIFSQTMTVYALWNNKFLDNLFSDKQLLQVTDRLPFSTAAYYMLSCMRYSLYLLPVLLGCLAFARPRLPDFWTSLSACPWNLGLVRRILFAILQYYFGFLISDLGTVIILSGSPFLFAVIDQLGIMRWVEDII